MPYNTRRKSLSLPSLGIHLPNGSRAKENALVAATTEQPPQKKVKRIHQLHQTGKISIRRSGAYEPTPPPSPPPENRINLEGINDEIVSGVVEIIEKTGNRPHTVKELAERLLPVLGIVENSANPHAIISSRLNAYLKRGFSDECPCLLAKQLITTHPRRIYFYLTTSPSQPIPEHEFPNLSVRRAIVSPALSDEDEAMRRRQLSPSPEVDLSSPEFDDDDLPPSPNGSSVSGSEIIPVRHPHHPNHTHHPSTFDHPSSFARRHVLSSPPLEGDEQEFTESAIMLQQRSVSREFEERLQQERERQESLKRSREIDHGGVERKLIPNENLNENEDGNSHHEGNAAEDRHNEGRDSEVAAALSLTTSGASDLSTYRSAWVGDVQSPESVELDELDDLLGEGFQ